MTDEKRPRGRPKLPEDQVSVPRSIRLTPAEWAKFDLLGIAWLKRALKRAKPDQQAEEDEG